jgi:hypothetical protein
MRFFISRRGAMAEKYHAVLLLSSSVSVLYPGQYSGSRKEMIENGFS